MQQVEVNLLAVLLAGLSTMPLGFLWFGTLFMKPWMKLMGYTKDSMDKNKQNMPLTYGVSAVASIVMAYVLAHVLAFADAQTMMDSLQGAFWVWLGFVATTMLADVLYGKKSLNLYAIDSGYHLVSLLVMSVILNALG